MIKLLIVGVFLVGMFYLYKFLFLKNKYLVFEGPLYLKDAIPVTVNNNGLIKSPEYTFSFWIKINNIGLDGYWKSKSDKPRLVIDNNGSPNVLYFVESNILRVSICYQGHENVLEYSNIDIPNIPQQRWNNIVVIVNLDRVQLFLNSKKYNSLKLNNPNIINYRNMILGDLNDNFNGYVAKINTYNFILDQDSISKNYNTGLNYFLV